MDKGRLKLRSNVVLDGNAWHLVPGDALQHYAPERLKLPHRPTQRQKYEHMYYVPCSYCGRTSHEIELQGCNECSHGPSRAAQQAAVARHERVQQEIDALRAGLSQAPASSDQDPSVQ